MSVFEGTRFEKLENSIKHDINRKRKSLGTDSAERTPSEGGHKKKVKAAGAERHAEKKPEVAKLGSGKERIDAGKPPKAAQPSSAPAPAVAPPAGSEEYVNNRTVYIQGLPFAASEQDVRSFFKGCGDISSVRLPKWHDSGKLKGYGHVEFKKAESATKALELNGEYLLDRYLSIDRPQVPRALSSAADAREPTAKPAGCRTIFIKNLPYETTEAEITEHFMVYGPIKSVRLAVWNHTGKLKGIGYVDFKREDSAETAVKKSGSVVLQGRKVVVDYETSAPKGSFKAKPGAAAPATARKQ
jgi:nucleolin